ncbi:hypothetical protein BaRGS_00005427 [Batillaria attramentaria]|uniref:G-protein coupled receptors family 1 profile domain-containing protein n=1 Tax=Batillaria attramentaria TaxID=370345 RepID=A0ABD0LWM2_9CAEN
MCGYDRSSVLSYMNVYAAVVIPLPIVGVGVFNLAIYRRWRKSRRRVDHWTRRAAITQTRSLFEREIAGHGLSRGKSAEGLDAVSSSKTQPLCSSRHKEDDTGGCSSNSVRRPHTRQADAGGDSSFVKEVVFADSENETSKEDREAVKSVVHGAAIKQEGGAPEPPLQTDPFVSDAVDKSQGKMLQTYQFVSGVVNKSQPTLQTYPCVSDPSKREQRKVDFFSNADADTDISEINVTNDKFIHDHSTVDTGVREGLYVNGETFGHKTGSQAWDIAGGTPKVRKSAQGERKRTENVSKVKVIREAVVGNRRPPETKFGCVGEAENQSGFTKSNKTVISKDDTLCEREHRIEALPKSDGICGVQNRSKAEESPSALTGTNTQYFTVPICKGRSKKIVSVSITTTGRSGEHAESQPSNTKGGNGGNTRIKASDISLVRSLLAVWVCLLVLCPPYLVGCLVSVYTGGSAELFLTIIWLLFLNNAVNWFLYGALNKAFRKPLLQLLTRLCRFW